MYLLDNNNINNNNNDNTKKYNQSRRKKKTIGTEVIIQYCSILKNIDVNKTKRHGQVIYIYFEASKVRNTIG